jgi:hypothetical protein
LSAEQQSLAADRQAFEAERQTHLAEIDKLSAKARDALEQVAEQAAAMAAARDEIQWQQQAWTLEREQLQARLVAEQEHCQRQSADMETLRSELERRQVTDRSEQVESEQQLELRRIELDRRAEALEAERRDLQSRREQLDAAAAAALVPPAAAADPAAANAGIVPADTVSATAATEPIFANADASRRFSDEAGRPAAIADRDNEDVATDDIFARLRSLALLKEDGSESQLMGSSGLDESEVAEAKSDSQELAGEQGLAPLAAAPKGETDEESIDDYMARLLHRVRGISQDQPAAVVRGAPAAARPPVFKPAAAVALTESKPASVAAADHPLDAKPLPADQPVMTGPLVARSAPPEAAANIAAMRELANTAARRAISHHAKGRSGRIAASKAFSALLVLGVGAWLLWKSMAGSLAYRYSGAAALIVAAFWLVQAAALARGSRMTNRADKSSGAVSKTGGKKAAPGGGSSNR